MLDINNLQASVEGKAILKGLDLHVKAGEVHAIMGPNGSGKSTLAQVMAVGSRGLLGRRRQRHLGTVRTCSPCRSKSAPAPASSWPSSTRSRSRRIERLLPQAAVNAVRKHRGLPEFDAMDFLTRVKAEMKAVGMKEEFLYRSVNEGFSGGEKKRNEVLQMALLEPRLAILDETDSGLDIDALKVVADGVNRLRSPDRALIVITHYQRLLDYIVPDQVHVLSHGRIVRSGGRELALELEEKGYGWIGDSGEVHHQPPAAGAAS